MAADAIFNAIADLTRIDQDGTLERIVTISGQTMSAVVTKLKTNIALVDLKEGNIRLKVSYTDDASWETAVTALGSSWI
jgi:hypothetical protein